MLALQRLCFNCPKDDLFFGQVNLNSKKPGHEGGGWHSHWTGGGTDGVGQPNIAGSVEDFMQENLQNLNLTYPAGVGADSGAINVIPGTPLVGSPLFPPSFGMVASWVCANRLPPLPLVAHAFVCCIRVAPVPRSGQLPRGRLRFARGRLEPGCGGGENERRGQRRFAMGEADRHPRLAGRECSNGVF